METIKKNLIAWTNSRNLGIRQIYSSINLKNKTLKTFSKSVGDSRQTYKLANNLGGKSTLSQYITNSSHEKAKGDQKRCCQFIQQILYRNRENVLDRIPHHPLKPAESQIQSMYLLDTDDNEVIEIRNRLDKKTSSEEYEICNVLVKMTSQIIAPLLT